MKQNQSRVTTSLQNETIESTQTGQPRRRKKSLEFSRLFHSHKLTFPQVIATKSKRNNDLHQGS